MMKNVLLALAALALLLAGCSSGEEAKPDKAAGAAPASRGTSDRNNN